MKKLVFFVLVIAILGAVTLPLLYFYYSQALPDLSTKAAIEAAIARRVEAERMANASVAHPLAADKFEVLPKDKLPKGLVLGLIAVEGCPEYLDSPREEGKELALRLFTMVGDGSGGSPGPGRCQVRFADLIVETIGVVDRTRAAIADRMVHSALTPEELLTYRLASTFYAQGIVGTRAASRALFGKEPARLDLAEAAELIVAESYYPDVIVCKNPPRLKLLRDSVLDRMEGFGLITATESKRAQARGLGCLAHP